MALAAAIWMSRKMSAQSQKAGYPDDSTLSAFCITFRPEDKILLFPPSLQTARWLRGAVEQFWALDSADNQNENCYTLNLTGAPFLKHSSRENALLLKSMCCQILETLKLHGWQLVLCTDLSCKSDLTAWYFAREPKSCDPPESNYGPNTNKQQQQQFQAKSSLSVSSAEQSSICSSSSNSFVCLSLSKNCKLQIVNATSELQQALKASIDASYPPGIDKETRRGRDYEIKLKGNPWNTRNRVEVVAACSVIINVFRRFHFSGYQLYGIVNLKETADSFIFEYDPRQTDANDRYMIIDIADTNILRLVGAPDIVVEVVEETLRRHWGEQGIVSKNRIDTASGDEKCSTPRKKSIASSAWEFVLNGSPWRAKLSKIGKSRQLITYLLDDLLANGWTVASGLDMSRAEDSKSVLLLQCCQPVPGIQHACLSPLGKHSLQIINAPQALRQLIRAQFADILRNEKLSSDGNQFELTLTDFPWDPDPHKDQDSYTEVRRRMGSLLQTLMDERWMVIASADVAHEAENSGDHVGIHSWFLIDCGAEYGHGGGGLRVTANSVLQVAGRVGSSRSRMMSLV